MGTSCSRYNIHFELNSQHKGEGGIHFRIGKKKEGRERKERRVGDCLNKMIMWVLCGNFFSSPSSVRHIYVLKIVLL